MDKKRKNLLLFTNTFPTPPAPERGIYKYQLANAFTTRFNVTVVCPLPWFPKFGALRRFSRWYQFAAVPPQYEWKGIDVFAPKYAMLPRVSSSMHHHLMYMGVQKTVRRVISEKKIDIINSHWLYPDSVVAERIAGDLGVPHVPTGSGSDINSFFQDDRIKSLIVPALKRSKHVIVVSRQLREQLIQAGVSADAVTTAMNGVDTELFRPRERDLVKQALGLPDDSKLTLYVGRLSEEKGVDVLIEAFSKLPGKTDDVFLVVAGSGDEERSLREQADRLGIRDRVRFLGMVNYSTIPEWMNAADCLCLPSLQEGCPNAVLEALACGVPVVASSVGAVPDMINEQSGRMVPPCDADLLAKSLSEVLAGNWDRARIRDTVVGHTWEKRAEVYIDVFDSIVSNEIALQDASASG